MEDLKEYSEYSYNIIKYICEKIGPRYSSSKAEKKANIFLKTQLDEFCEETYLEEFPTYPNLYPQGILRILFGSGLIAFILHLLAYPYFISASIIIFLGLIIIILEFMLIKQLMRPFFKKGTSSNVFGIIKPKNKPRVRVLLCGHTDSAKLLRWPSSKHIRFVTLLLILSILYCLAILIYPIVKISLQASGIVTLIFNWYIFEISNLDLFFLPVGSFLLIVFIITFAGLLSDKVVLGANDNLSGCATVLALGKYFKKNRLENVELILLSTGSEEIGERGAAYFIKKHPELCENSLTLAFECVGAGKRIFVVQKDIMHIAKYSKEVIDYVKRAHEDFKTSNETKLDFKAGNLFLGSSDANMFIKNGYKAAFIINQDTSLIRPSKWHSFEDTLEFIDKEVLEEMIGISIKFVSLIDDDYSKIEKEDNIAY